MELKATIDYPDKEKEQNDENKEINL